MKYKYEDFEDLYKLPEDLSSVTKDIHSLDCLERDKDNNLRKKLRNPDVYQHDQNVKKYLHKIYHNLQ